MVGFTLRVNTINSTSFDNMLSKEDEFIVPTINVMPRNKQKSIVLWDNNFFYLFLGITEISKTMEGLRNFPQNKININLYVNSSLHRDAYLFLIYFNRRNVMTLLK